MPVAPLAHGRRVHYVERGEAKGRAPVVLVHGAGASSAIWMMAMARLAPAARVVAIDLPGHGQSSPPAESSLSIDGYRDAVGELATTLGLGPSVLVGHSMGVLVALAAALAWPDQVRALVLCAGAPRLPLHDELITLLQREPARVPQWMAEHGLSPRVRPAVRRAFVAAPLPTPPEIMLADFEAVRAVDLTDRLGALTGPVTWLDGADDRMVPPVEGRPGVVRTLEGVGHLVPIEAPDAIAEAVASVS